MNIETTQATLANEQTVTPELEEKYFGPLDEKGEPYYNEKTKAILIEKAERLEKIFARQRQPASYIKSYCQCNKCLMQSLMQ
jgi:hypothetical protein